MIRTMKKSILVAVVLVAAMFSVNAQTYFNLSAGPSFVAGKAELTTGGLEGSYGEGFQIHGRVGTYVTDALAMEFGVGYLNGKEQSVLKDAAQGLEVMGTGKAIGAALTARYDITNGLYARAGVLTKLGGKTEVVANVTRPVPASLFNPALPAGVNANLVVDVERENKGKFPLGFVVGLGYQYNVTDNIALFVDAQLESIKVTAKDSKLESYKASATIGEQTLPVDATTLAGGIGALQQAGALTASQAGQLKALISNEYTYGEGGIPEFKSPYSNFGIMFGASFSF